MLYICEIIFHRAEHVPVGDLSNLSCDPYIHADLEVSNPQYHSRPISTISYRTPTIRRTLNPIYNARWVIGGIPDVGFTLTLCLRDEYPYGSYDCLGMVVIRLPDSVSGQPLEDGWDTGEVAYKVEKSKGSFRSHAATYLATIISRGRISHHARIVVSARVVRTVLNQADHRIFTIGPSKYTRHFSPLIGHLIRRGIAANKARREGKNNKPISTSTFVANRLQLVGPLPYSLRHPYVGYSPFIRSLFKKSSIKGRIFSFALRRQFKAIYGYDKSTVYGIAGEGEVNTDGCHQKKAEHKSAQSASAGRDVDNTVQGECGDMAMGCNGIHPSSHQSTKTLGSSGEALSREFLRMTSYGTAGRLFTYVITLDSEWRFTETGRAFSVDMLSKHTMHADMATEVAFSGEFFVRRIFKCGEDGRREDGESDSEWDGQDAVSDNLKDYELVIDNSSGTYRPKTDQLAVLQRWLSQEEILGSLGKVTAMDGSDETLQRWKDERQEEKQRAKRQRPHIKKCRDARASTGHSGEQGSPSTFVGERAEDAGLRTASRLDRPGFLSRIRERVSSKTERHIVAYGQQDVIRCGTKPECRRHGAAPYHPPFYSQPYDERSSEQIHTA